MKILAKALCDHIHRDGKVSLLGAFQHLFLKKDEKSLALRGHLFVSLQSEKGDVVKKKCIVRVFLTNAKEKELCVFFTSDLAKHAKESGINLLLDVQKTQEKMRKLTSGVYSFWLEVNGVQKEWITDVTIAKHIRE